jgi:hypothetical protein
MNNDESLIYITNLSNGKGNINISHEMIKSKLVSLGYKGTIYISEDLKGHDTIKDAADVIIYWVAKDYDDEEGLVDDISRNSGKAVIGCWPYSINAKLLKLIAGEDIAYSLDEVIAKATDRIDHSEKYQMATFQTIK